MRRYTRYPVRSSVVCACYNVTSETFTRHDAKCKASCFHEFSTGSCACGRRYIVLMMQCYGLSWTVGRLGYWSLGNLSGIMVTLEQHTRTLP
jgi:hypothetical protein